MKYRLKIIGILMFLSLTQQSFAHCIICEYIPTGMNASHQLVYSWKCSYFEGLDCGVGIVPQQGMSNDRHSYCQQMFQVKTNPIKIHLQNDGRALIEYGRKIVAIASDKLNNLMTAAIHDGENKSSQKQILNILKNDDGIVSEKRINAIAKDLNAKIIKSIQPITPNYCPACDEEKIKQHNTTFDNDGEPVLRGGFGGAEIYLGGGITINSTHVKENTSLPNLNEINIGTYIPVYRYRFGRDDKVRWSLGIDINTAYNFSNRDNCPMTEPFQILNQTGVSTTSQKGSGSPKNQGFRIGAGPALMFNVSNQFSLIPALNVAYSSINKSSCVATQTSSVNGTVYHWDLYRQKMDQSSGVAFIPKLRFQYLFGRLGIWAEGNYMMGQKINFNSASLHPSNAAQNGQYERAQLDNGSYKSIENKTSYNRMGINGGVVFNIGAKPTLYLCGCCGKRTYIRGHCKICEKPPRHPKGNNR